MKTLLISSFVLSLSLLTSCAHSSTGAVTKSAKADIVPRSGTTTAGTAEFVQKGNDVTLTLRLTGALPGPHAVHIHEFADCSTADALSAGDHWNPARDGHGKFGVLPFHLGDIGNIDVGADGTGVLNFSTSRWSIGTRDGNDVAGHAIVVHSSLDDLQSQPAGNSGDRIACGEIVTQ